MFVRDTHASGECSIDVACQVPIALLSHTLLYDRAPSGGLRTVYISRATTAGLHARQKTAIQYVAGENWQTHVALVNTATMR